MSITIDQTIDELLASGRVQGDVQVAGRITAAELQTTASGYDWAVLMLDDGTAVIEVHVLPRTWRDVTVPILTNARLAVTGLLNAVSGELTIIALSVTVADPA
ncbi:hypothetical protein [Kitasatospora kifunensis]|uniref:DNA polymerase III alpha subunit n=1 Tax=Kitasatospora kifunensis TaxID=58351 RepID=A0A7W7VTD1_KITKI|nr:hypothetical protein [Kitasatospora kifunensis]MBB4922171.1 DNA polymerase III alpha subunit [Kitasatospora kifunensis]